jgi:hypothetical protein
MLSSPHGTRLIYEPANLFDHSFDGVRAAGLELPDEHSTAAGFVIAAMYGTLRGPWVDQHNHAHLVRRRVVKDVRAIKLAGKVHSCVPDAPVVVLVRHPIAVARSVRELGWIDHDDLEEAFAREVERWCSAHAELFGDSRVGGVHFLDYATLRSEPVEQITSLADYARAKDATWRSIRASRIDVRRPSSTNFRGSSTTEATEHVWHSVSPESVAFATDCLTRHGLDALYGSSPRALMDVNEFAAKFRGHDR